MILTELKDEELAGTYYPLKVYCRIRYPQITVIIDFSQGMTKDVQNALIKDHFLFKEGDRFLKEANACRFWPNVRYP